MKDFLLRKPLFAKFTADIDEAELEQPDIVTVLKVVWYSVSSFIKERPGQILGLGVVLIMLWGPHGNLELLKLIVPEWRGPGVDVESRAQLLPGIPWDQELISFWAGAVLLVIIPVIVIKFGFRQPLSSYGLGFPPKDRRLLALWTFLLLMGIGLPVFWLGSKDPAMRQLYPLYKSFSSSGEFLLYELSYLPFFIAIEFIYRGYMLFGLAGVLDDEVKGMGGGAPSVFYFGKYALLLQMLSYTAWHLGKPIPELMGTVVWGLAAGATAYSIRSIWPIVLSHWLLNVFLDALIVGFI